MYVCNDKNTAVIFIVFKPCFYAGADCIDREGHHVTNGERFAPDEDPCKTCYCVDGVAQLCTLVQCSPPSCPKWEPVLNQCCKFRCLDWPLFGDDTNKSSQGLHIYYVIYMSVEQQLFYRALAWVWGLPGQKWKWQWSLDYWQVILPTCLSQFIVISVLLCSHTVPAKLALLYIPGNYQTPAHRR